MPTITVRMLSGRSEVQKAQFTVLVRDAAVRILQAPYEKVKIEFQEVSFGPTD